MVLTLAIFIELRLSGWMKSVIDWAIKSISSSDTLLINPSSHMWLKISGVLGELVGNFPGDSKYSELL